MAGVFDILHEVDAQVKIVESAYLVLTKRHVTTVAVSRRLIYLEKFSQHRQTLEYSMSVSVLHDCAYMWTAHAFSVMQCTCSNSISSVFSLYHTIFEGYELHHRHAVKVNLGHFKYLALCIETYNIHDGLGHTEWNTVVSQEDLRPGQEFQASVDVRR